jgi:AraC family transcriptional regulator
MAIRAQVLASGEGWTVQDVRCNSGPRDRAFPEQHAQTAIAAVMEGSFQYRTQAGSALLVPGSLLLGNAGSCFECGHEHACGDRCLSFHFSPALFESVATAAPGARSTTLTRAGLPPASALLGVLADAEVARDEHDAGALEEVAIRLAGVVLILLTDDRRPARRVSPRDERRVTAAVRHIEARAGQEPGLIGLAQAAAMSPYHFLRTFRQVIGTTPHQYVLHTRLHRAARRLRATGDPISQVALEAGFNDLATFNHRFRRLIGMTPSAFRAASA